MPREYVKSKFPGVRYREHATRKHGVKFDRYYFIRYKLDGKDKEEGLGWASQGWTEQKAAARLAELKENQRTGQGPRTLHEKRVIADEKAKREAKEKARTEQAAVTFGSIFSGPYLEHSRQNKKPNSVVTENGLFTKWIAPVIGDVSLKDISPFHLERVMKTMNDAGLTPRSVAYAMSVVRQVYNFARDRELTECLSPTSKVKTPKTDNRRLRFLTHEEANNLLDYLAQRVPDLHDIALLCLHCGLRAGEIFNLTWGDVDFKRELLTLRDTKNGKTRPAFMTSRVREILTQKSKYAESDLVFPGRGGVKRTYVSNAFERAVQHLGFNEGITDHRQKVVFHTLRHTFASWLVEQGTDLYSVKELMGHSTLSMTERYSHLAPDSLRRTIKSFDVSLATASAL
ncbi:tyrosine-type recombinase/integrase [Desulfolutivibrio sp.]|uniref:tyrosine-type recombinase/integrase n=1 Tax=Desulfolutivibrio sp. TaxID=2773296 RepID=UPI002F96652B